MSTVRLAILCLICSGQPGVAEDMYRFQGADASLAGQSVLGTANGLLMVDYEAITLTNGGEFDLVGVHLLHQLNDWLYAGFGFGAPLVEGYYGGFFFADLTLHAQQKVFGNWFVDAGLAIGAGAGGSSIANIKDLSGSGSYMKKYIGLGYDAGNFNIGLNYADVGISGSLIDDAVINFFVQLPLSYSVGSHADAGATISPAKYGSLGHESIVSFEYSNVTQIGATGRYSGDIGLVSPQFSQFFDDDNYYFVGLDLGYSGLIWYNQAQGGIGRRLSLSPNINLYGQIGVGSGGWVTDTIDTGPGLVVYPKVKAEYMFNNSIGASVSAGYLFAPMGTSRNWSLGAGINYHLPSSKQAMSDDGAEHDVELRGLRLNLFYRNLSGIVNNGIPRDDLSLSSVQFDYSINDDWYIPIQIAAAMNDFAGYAGYVEGLAGLGWQHDLFGSDRIQGYAQLMYGMNDIGVDAAHEVGALLYPSVGFNYNLNDRYSVYGQFGRTVSLGQYLEPGFTNYFEGTSIGLGMSYRFSLPTWGSR